MNEASGKFLLRMPPKVHGEAAQAAKDDHSSLNAWVVHLIIRALAKREAQQHQVEIPPMPLKFTQP